MRGKRCQLCAAIISPKTRGRPRNSVQAAARIPEPPRPELGGQLIRSKCSSNRARRLSPAQWNERVAR